MYHLTRKQQQLLDFIIENQDRFPQPPTLDELCFAMGLKSRGSLHKHIQELINAGYIEALNRKQRGVRLTAQYLEQNVSLAEPEQQGTPFVGAIAAGTPIEALENICYMNVPDEIKTDKPCYILQVKGDSMIDDGIFEGDWVIIEQQSHARNGQIVVALIDKADATLKYIEQYPHETVLVPANKNMRPMRFHPQQVEIQGVLVGQMRSYK
ncbi:MAG: transcriptional repressor LexA [Methylococcales symbiont of Hymedesmia sp. n. MRB-2018]|nr:MAG: transcriptional repressor LexA [Methylococcales symbiont of Hymedesmia sp. n. MRB-2018]